MLHLGLASLSVDHGAVTVRVDGVAHQYTVAALNTTSSSLVNVSGSTIRLQRGPDSQGTRLWVAHNGSLAADSYAYFSLLGKRLSYDLDLSNSGCSCNAALYWVSMPGYGADGTLAPGDMGNYYCDANKHALQFEHASTGHSRIDLNTRPSASHAVAHRWQGWRSLVLGDGLRRSQHAHDASDAAQMLGSSREVHQVM